LRPAAARVARNVAWLGAGEVALKGALFGAGVLVARGFGPAGMGVFTVAYGAALVLMQLLSGGQVEVLIRETARRPGDGRALLVSAHAHQHRIAAVALPAAVALALLVPAADLRWALLAFAPYSFLRRWLITAGAVFKGMDRMDVEVRARSLELAVTLPCLALLAYAGAPVWCSGLAFTAGGVAGVAWIALRVRELPPCDAAMLSRARLAREGAPFLGLTMLHQLVARADSFLLAGLGVSRADIGRYGVATAPVQGLGATSQVLAVASYPTLARWAAQGRLRARWVLAIAGTGAALGTCLGVALYAVREPLIRIVFGPEFAGSAPLLAVLAWMLPATCTSMLAGTVLAATRRQHWPLASQSVLLVVSVCANLYAVPRWGVRGSAVVALALAATGALVATTLAVIAARAARRAAVEAAPIGAVAEGVE